MPWRSLSHLDLDTLRAVEKRGNAPVMAGFGPRHGWSPSFNFPLHVINRLVAASLVQTSCGCSPPCYVRLTGNGYRTIEVPIPKRWGIWEGKCQWP